MCNSLHLLSGCKSSIVGVALTKCARLDDLYRSGMAKALPCSISSFIWGSGVPCVDSYSRERETGCRLNGGGRVDDAKGCTCMFQGPFPHHKQFSTSAPSASVVAYIADSSSFSSFCTKKMQCATSLLFYIFLDLYTESKVYQYHS